MSQGNDIKKFVKLTKRGLGCLFPLKHYKTNDEYKYEKQSQQDVVFMETR